VGESMDGPNAAVSDGPVAVGHVVFDGAAGEDRAGGRGILRRIEPAFDSGLAGAELSRVVARLFRFGLSVTGPFVCRCLNSLAVPRFHHPLFEPDRRISRIRLTDQIRAYAFRGTRRKRAGRFTKPYVSYNCISG
jgi:hypothetical protein